MSRSLSVLMNLDSYRVWSHHSFILCLLVVQKGDHRQMTGGFCASIINLVDALIIDEQEAMVALSPPTNQQAYV